MKLVVCSVFDRSVRAYSQVHLFRTFDEGARAFVATCSDPNNNLRRNPGDYEFIHIGYFDDSTGKFFDASGGNSMTVYQAVGKLEELAASKSKQFEDGK
jgi:hypothetical protein